MSKPYGFKIKDTATGLFSGPGKIGCRWNSVGRTWTNRGSLSASITIWQDLRTRPWYSNRSDPQNWVVAMMTDRGLVEFAFADWCAAKGKKELPEPVNQPPKMTLTINEIDEVEEALRTGIGDADEAGELSQRVINILMTHLETTV